MKMWYNAYALHAGYLRLQTYIEYLIIFAFPPQCHVRESASMLRLYLHCLSCFSLSPFVMFLECSGCNKTVFAGQWLSVLTFWYVVLRGYSGVRICPRVTKNWWFLVSQYMARHSLQLLRVLRLWFRKCRRKCFLRLDRYCFLHLYFARYGGLMYLEIGTNYCSLIFINLIHRKLELSPWTGMLLQKSTPALRDMKSRL